MLPMFQRQGASAYKASLDTTYALDKYFNHPHRNYKTIHVGGTNGKGSTSHMLASILQEQGYKTGLYTSPHLLDFRERIKVNGNMIEKEYVVDFIEQNNKIIEKLCPSFFEITVAMALQLFADQRVDIAVIEVGMGGRLDSTNIITPLISIITNISKDHCQFLGNTEEEIAKEKGGIIKEHIPIVLGEQNDKTDVVFRKIAHNKKSPLIHASPENIFDSEQISPAPDLRGNYQQKNISTVVATCNELQQRQLLFIQRNSIEKGISNTIKNTGLLGRWQTLLEKPLTICDTAHNYAGIKEVSSQLRNLQKKLHIVWGMVSDKNIEDIIDLLPTEATYYITQPNISRAMQKEDLFVQFQSKRFTASVHNSVSEAFKHAIKNAQKNDVIFIGGSTFVVADFLEGKY